MRPIDIREESVSFLPTYAGIPISFKVDRVLEAELRENGLGGIALIERQVQSGWVKDYDAIPGNHPSDWPGRFDMSNWGILSARSGEQVVGGTVLAFGTPGLDMLEGRDDLVVIWDIRVFRDHRGRGVGSELFAQAELWAKQRGAGQLKVETQNVNVDACRFYASRGCRLGAIHRFAYPELPGEIQLLWYKDLA